MFGFKLWAQFGVFRDPITITQNLTLPIPPKTTIGGMLASILGIDYNNYFNDPKYFDFNYSIIFDNEKTTRKKSFTQNYIEDYTKNAENKFNAINSLILKQDNIVGEINRLKEVNTPESIEYMKENKNVLKILDDITGKMTKPKPIYREILINPSYLVFVDNFKYEKEIIKIMLDHYSSYLLYMGNSEFPANYEYLKCKKIKQCLLHEVNSFTQNLDKINFESERKYSTLYFATKVVGNRQYRDYKKIVICNKTISFNQAIQGYRITLSNEEINCEFI